MEMQTESRLKTRRLQVLAGGKIAFKSSNLVPDTGLSLICHDGVVVQHISVGGLELVEIEFPDAA